MSISKIVEHSGVYIDLSKVKCIRLSHKKTVVIEFKTRIEYVRNPFTEQLEKEYINDAAEIEYPNSENANGNIKEWVRKWQMNLSGKL